MFDYDDITPKTIAYSASARATEFGMDPLKIDDIDYLAKLIHQFVHDSNRITAFYATWLQNPQIGFPIPDAENDFEKGLDLIIITDTKCYSFTSIGDDFRMGEQPLDYDYKHLIFKKNFLELSWGFTDTRWIFSIIDYVNKQSDIMKFSQKALTK